MTRDQVYYSSKGMSLKPMSEKSSQWQPNLADWRSQDLGSKGQLNCVWLGSITTITMEKTSPAHSYNEIVTL